ncbi:LytR/AlgR family response regulator transcription factor [Flagellimonas pacifica]|uniref:LytTr DNA-binding domain-containing protein n=1 Tax=Flagellimonas pacifica TaxID=1247520 RepID=A0A285MFC0_9FLAO|nr:LytTR family DNA-binding domain-containing protein [Allomuricauda parva]SNY95167.1 LytTr DNA-binding domain-containing protein [Allomuricauda parva]
MAKQISLVSIFVLLNMGIGRMFQESLGATCFSELSILAITSFFFWNISAKQIKTWAGRWAVDSTGKNVLLQGGIGLSASAINILVGQFLVIFLMTTIYNCTSPSFNMLNASLTNNVGVNLLCYFSLLFYFVGIKKDKSAPQQNNRLNQKNRVAVSKRGSQFLLEPREIVYVETSNNCIVLHTQKGRFVKYQSLRSFAQTLCPNTFKRIHRSYLVNSEFIDQIQKNNSGDGKLRLKTGDDLKFSRTYLQELSHI